ncbi:MAG TPA: hypothetical protein VIO57_07395 [Chloroflexota bacterium]|jgi:hypothetical protein
MDAVSFAQDVRPLFRDKDVDSMMRAVDLTSYDDVKTQAEAIYDRVSRGSMPCDGAWPPERTALFRRWMDQGYSK